VDNPAARCKVEDVRVPARRKPAPKKVTHQAMPTEIAIEELELPKRYLQFLGDRLRPIH
jgi:hypothetical protein